MPGFRSFARTAVNQLVAPLGLSVISQDQLRGMRQRLERLAYTRKPDMAEGLLPEGAADYLHAGNPRLEGLRSRYAAFRCPANEHSLWESAHRAKIDLQYFRGENPYIYQIRDDNTELHYLLTAFYLESIDVLGLFQRFEEDGQFGAHIFALNNRTLISRDLLDSIAEITFLEESLGISRIEDLRILDIGAGYGRMGYRLATALPNLKRILCTDAVPESTFLCEYYLRFRGVTGQAEAVPLDEAESAAAGAKIHLAMNIHSFSECSLAAVRWWLDLVSKNRIDYLFIVPNADAKGALLTTEKGKPGEDFLPEILSRGYRLLNKRPKYCLPALQKYGISPTHYYLFERG
jgi:hypothetical protein